MVPKIVIDLVDEYSRLISVRDILSILNVSKSTYYRWKKQLHSNFQEYTSVERDIIDLCKNHHYRYEYRKIASLMNQKYPINKNTVQRIMQKQQCQCRVKVKRNNEYKYQPIIMENKLDRDFKEENPLEKLVTDITYIPYGSKMLYLSTIMHLYNGEIIASTLSYKQDLECVIDSLNQLPTIKKKCILHSDQGSVYTSKEYQTRVKNKSIIMSKSRKGTPPDNASIESFH